MTGAHQIPVKLTAETNTCYLNHIMFIAQTVLHILWNMALPLQTTGWANKKRGVAGYITITLLQIECRVCPETG